MANYIDSIKNSASGTVRLPISSDRWEREWEWKTQMNTIFRLFLILSLNVISPAYADIPIPARDPFSNASSNANQNSFLSSNSAQIMQSCWIPLYFAQADTVAAFISKKSSGILSASGKINRSE